MILVYYKHGLILPAAEPREHGYCFNGNAVRTLRRIEDLRTVSGINVSGMKIILKLSNTVEEFTFNRYARRLTESVNLESRARRWVTSGRGGSPEPPVGD